MKTVNLKEVREARERLAYILRTATENVDLDKVITVLEHEKGEGNGEGNPDRRTS